MTTRKESAEEENHRCNLQTEDWEKIRVMKKNG